MRLTVMLAVAGALANAVPAPWQFTPTAYHGNPPPNSDDEQTGTGSETSDGDDVRKSGQVVRGARRVPAADNKWPEIIKDCREQRGMTQADFADTLGVDQGSVSRWECGRVVPDALIRKRLVTMQQEAGVARVGARIRAWIAMTPGRAALISPESKFVCVSRRYAARLGGLTPAQMVDTAVATYGYRGDFQAMMLAMAKEGLFENKIGCARGVRSVITNFSSVIDYAEFMLIPVKFPTGFGYYLMLETITKEEYDILGPYVETLSPEAYLTLGENETGDPKVSRIHLGEKEVPTLTREQPPHRDQDAQQAPGWRLVRLA